MFPRLENTISVGDVRLYPIEKQVIVPLHEGNRYRGMSDEKDRKTGNGS